MERKNNRNLPVMKLISTIMLPIVLSLSLLPCCPPMDTCSDQTKHSCDDAPLQGTAPSSGLCSPFYTCGNCPGLIFEQVDFPTLTVEKINKTIVGDLSEFKPLSLTNSLFKPPQA
ncbi:hypothetical protein [Echinicola salinicaeni]|uniref:hypothetical protein n=1 Tax=Echinicola salinicaeni TaxID=2762757 RepID=UPI0016469888|nr:hypothetical protein [Echinicola salinicaeni]